MLVLVCPGGLADLLGHGPAGTESVAVDSETARSSRTETAAAAPLPSAVTAAGRTLSQRDTGRHNIAAGLREVSYTPFTLPLDLLGLPPTCNAA
ncbi:hypothetical protein [Streptomyces sp. NPDC055085]